MSDPFYSKKSIFGISNALLMLMVVFFFVPFAGRGARMAMQRTENNVKDWLPSDFRETEELAWFAKRFVSEQFVLATWQGCTADDQRLKMFVSKLRQDVMPAEDEAGTDAYAARRLGFDYALFVDKELHENWGGKNEKWLVDEHGRHYYITPNGRLYRWEGKSNVVGALWRALQRATGSFQLEGQFVAAVGEPGTEERPNPFWQEPRRLTAPLFKSIETGPDLVEQLTGPEGSLATPTNPAAGRRNAIARLTGTMFGPPVPHGFSWTADELKEILPAEKLAELPEGWESVWELIVQQQVDSRFGGQRERLLRTDPVEQSEVWYAFFDAIAVEEPPRQTCVLITLTEPARRNLKWVIGRGILGSPRGRVFDVAEECGVTPPPPPTTAPPPFSLLAQGPELAEPVLHIGGPPVDNVAIDEEGSITLVRLIGYSLALGLGLSWLLLRSTRLMTMVFFVGGVSAMASLSMVWWCHASVDAILLTMPSLVYVLGMAGAIHIINYYRDAVVEEGQRLAPERAISHAVVPCTLAALTTAIGLLSLCSSNILPIRKFGIFSAMGVMATLVLLYIYLPSALTVFPPPAKKLRQSQHGSADRILRFWEGMGNFILRRHWLVNALCLTTMIGLGYGLTKIRTSVQLLKLFDSDSQIIRDYAWLESNFGRLVPMELVVRFPKELQRPLESDEVDSVDELKNSRIQMSVLERAEAVARIQQVLQDQFGYEGEDIVGRGMSAVTLLGDMPVAEPGFRARLKRSAANRLLSEALPKLLKTDYLAIEDSPEAAGTELWRISLRLGALNDVDYGQFVSSLRSVVEPVLAGYRCREQVLREILAQSDEGDGRVRGEVLVLGFDKPADTAADAPLDSGSRPQSPAEDRSLVDTSERKRLFAETLAHSLVNETISQTMWHDPERFPLDNGKATSDKWAAYLKQFECIVLLDPHPQYDLEFIRQANPHIVDAHQMLQAVDSLVSSPPQKIDRPVEQVAYPGSLDVVYTGVVPVVYKAQRTLLISLIESVAWAFALIAVVMTCLLSPARTFWQTFRPDNLMQAVAAGAISMIPNVFPVVVIFGFMGHLGTLIDIGTMMTASVAMGVAVDDTIHFLTWFRNGLREGLDRRAAIFKAYTHVAPAMTQTTIIGGLGLSVFALSTFTPTQRFGTLMLTLLSAALVGDLIFLPALLASPLGRIFRCHAPPPSRRPDAHGGNGAARTENSTTEVATASHSRYGSADEEYRLQEDDLTAQPRRPYMLRPDVAQYLQHPDRGSPDTA
ncbi:MAG: membrane protein [Pirellulaceae bacterium]|nr:MAG: membrane protein [Pirellulaceae bacterium]